MRKQDKVKVMKEIQEFLRSKYGTYAGSFLNGKMDLINDEDADELIISVGWLSETEE